MSIDDWETILELVGCSELQRASWTHTVLRGRPAAHVAGVWGTTSRSVRDRAGEADRRLWHPETWPGGAVETVAAILEAQAKLPPLEVTAWCLLDVVRNCRRSNPTSLTDHRQVLASEDRR